MCVCDHEPVLYACIRMHMQCMHACLHACMSSACMHICMQCHACLHACRHACIAYANMSACICNACMSACIYACMHACMHAYMHICMHACIICIYMYADNTCELKRGVDPDRPCWKRGQRRRMTTVWGMLLFRSFMESAIIRSPPLPKLLQKSVIIVGHLSTKLVIIMRSRNSNSWSCKTRLFELDFRSQTARRAICDLKSSSKNSSCSSGNSSFSFWELWTI